MNCTNLTYVLLAEMLERGRFELDDYAVLCKEYGLYVLRIYLGVDDDPHAELYETMQSPSLPDIMLYYGTESAKFLETKEQ